MFDFLPRTDLSGSGWLIAITAFIVVIHIVKSIRIVGPTEVGLVRKRFAWKKLGAV